MLLSGNWINPTDFKVNTGSGDGSTTIFALSHTPIADSVLYVYVDGIKRVLTVDFSLSGKNVTFVTAPANGQTIEFNYIKKD